MGNGVNFYFKCYKRSIHLISNALSSVENCQYTCPGGWEMRRVKSTLSDSDNIAISVQVQLELDLPTGTELGNNRMNTK